MPVAKRTLGDHFDSRAHCIERGRESILARLDLAQEPNSFARRFESRQIVALVLKATGEERLQ